MCCAVRLWWRKVTYLHLKCSHNFGTANACMSAKKSKDLQSLCTGCVWQCHHLCSHYYAVLAISCKAGANHVQVSITSSTHLCTVKEDFSGYLSVWEAVCVHAWVCLYARLCGCECLHVCVGIVKTAFAESVWHLCCDCRSSFGEIAHYNFLSLTFLGYTFIALIKLHLVFYSVPPWSLTLFPKSVKMIDK